MFPVLGSFYPLIRVNENNSDVTIWRCSRKLIVKYWGIKYLPTSVYLWTIARSRTHGTWMRSPIVASKCVHWRSKTSEMLLNPRNMLPSVWQLFIRWNLYEVEFRRVVHSKKSSYTPKQIPKNLKKIQGFIWEFKILIWE